MVKTEIILKYFPDIDKKTIHLFDKLADIYSTENEKVNLISRKDLENLYTNHILHSLTLAKFCSFKPGQTVIDIGTGGGFPGIPLAIMFPETSFFLCDSIGKKIRAVQSIVDALEIQNAHAINNRTELLPGPFDIAVVRAVAPMATLYSWMEGKWKNNIQLYMLKGGDLSEEMNSLLEIHPGLQIKQFPISDVYTEPFYETKKVVHILS